MRWVLFFILTSHNNETRLPWTVWYFTPLTTTFFGRTAEERLFIIFIFNTIYIYMIQIMQKGKIKLFQPNCINNAIKVMVLHRKCRCVWTRYIYKGWITCVQKRANKLVSDNIDASNLLKASRLYGEKPCVAWIMALLFMKNTQYIFWTKISSSPSNLSDLRWFLISC